MRGHQLGEKAFDGDGSRDIDGGMVLCNGHIPVAGSYHFANEMGYHGRGLQVSMEGRREVYQWWGAGERG